MTVAEDRLDATFSALADPTRRAIVCRLAKSDATVNELAEPFDITLPGISRHLKVLERSGLISRTRRAQFRPCHLETRGTRRGCAMDRGEPTDLTGTLRQARRARHAAVPSEGRGVTGSCGRVTATHRTLSPRNSGGH